MASAVKTYRNYAAIKHQIDKPLQLAQVGGLSFPGLGPIVVASSGPVTFDSQTSAATTVTGSTGGTALTNTITVGSNSNRVLLIGVGLSATGLTTAVTVNGSTTGVTKLNGASGTGSRTEIWTMLSPTGTVTVGLTWTSGTADAVIEAVSLFNANQTGGTTTFPSAAASVNAGTGSPASQNVPESSTSLYVVGFATVASATFSAAQNTQINIETTTNNLHDRRSKSGKRRR